MDTYWSLHEDKAQEKYRLAAELAASKQEYIAGRSLVVRLGCRRRVLLQICMHKLLDVPEEVGRPSRRIVQDHDECFKHFLMLAKPMS